MKELLMPVLVIISCALPAETSEEAYARLLSYRSIWDTNAVAYVRQTKTEDGSVDVEAKAKWFIDVMSFPDITETDRLDDVLYAKRQILQWNAGARGIIENTNCWYAVADFIARLKSAADPRWRGSEQKSPFNFPRYKSECLESYMRENTNGVSAADARRAFSREWKAKSTAKWNREVCLEKAQDKAKQIMKKSFWLFGAKDLPADVKAVCRSNIVERAHLTPEEEHDIFEDIPYWFKRLGIKHK